MFCWCKVTCSEHCPAWRHTFVGRITGTARIYRTKSFFSGECDNTHPALFAVGQQLVLLLGVEDERVRGEGNGLALEGGAFVGADEEHLVPLVYGGAHQHHLRRGRGWNRRERGLRSEVKRLMPHSVCMAQSAACRGGATMLPVSIPVHIYACGGAWTKKKKKSISERSAAIRTHSFKAVLPQLFPSSFCAA